MNRRLMAALLSLALLLAGCAPAPAVRRCNVVFETNEDVFFYRQVYPVVRGEDLTVSVGVPRGFRIATVNYDRYSVSPKTGESPSYDYYTLILHEIRYPLLVRLTVAPARVTVYHFGGETETVSEESPRLWPNTLAYEGRFAQPGQVAVGWNTAPDGSGQAVGFGSQLPREAATLDLFLETHPCSPASAFLWERRGEEVAVTGYRGTGDLVIPSYLEGLPVTTLAAGAFGDLAAETVVLPPTLKTLEAGAFTSLKAEALYLFDTLETVSGESFGTLEVTHLHLNAARPPVYCGTYFDTLSEKTAYLRSLAGQRKLVLFCGSSARFGYDSPLLQEAFPGCQVVNMGVYAYANMLPQARLLQQFLEPGDLLLSSPELDAIDCQFCASNALDRETFAMVESNYDLLSLLDLREFSGVFDAFGAYQAARQGMTPTSYLAVPAQFDEDGNRVAQLAYNRYGDYILYRENNEEGKNFGVKRAYYNPDHITSQDWAGLNRVYDGFTAQGVRVFFTYSPRSRTSLSPDSTEEAILALEALARETLHAQVISDIHASLMDPLYFYGTDNHLSTQGAVLHTQQVIADLRAALEASP